MAGFTDGEPRENNVHPIRGKSDELGFHRAPQLNSGLLTG
jgi:hypothetical protein